MRGVTYYFYTDVEPTYISTHTPHARRDFFGFSLSIVIVNFNSHASCEA